MSELSKSSGLMMYDLERSLYILKISSSSAEGVKTMTDIAFRGFVVASLGLPAKSLRRGRRSSSFHFRGSSLLAIRDRFLLVFLKHIPGLFGG
jgi:hypothetical protein